MDGGEGVEEGDRNRGVMGGKGRGQQGRARKGLPGH